MEIYNYILISILITALRIQMNESCWLGWSKVGETGHCYRLIESPLLTWYDAKRYCKLRYHNSSLSDVNGFNEQSLIADSFLKHSNVSEAWLGAIQKSYQWKWVTNKAFIPDDFCWYVDRQTLCGSQDYDWLEPNLCLAMHESSLFASLYCSHKLPFICKTKDLTIFPGTDGTTDNPPIKPTSASITSTDTLPTKVIVLAVVVPGVIICIIICITIVLVRRKQKNTAPGLISDTYEDLRRNDQTAEFEYSNLNTIGSNQQRHSTSEMTSHPAISNRVCSMGDHDYCSAIFSSTEQSVHLG
ncbi:hypothetical protein ACF0H5_021704 [Mactra antiquata]